MAVTVALVAVAVVALDQLTKWWALEALADGPVNLIGSLRLNLVFNRAGAFGLGGGLVPFMALGALALVVVFLVRGGGSQGAAAVLSSGLLVGGAIGNLIDRLVRSPGFFKGAVVDFVDLGFWPVFNLADSAITIGCVMLVLWGWRPAEAPAAAGTNPSPAGPSPAGGSR